MKQNDGLLTFPYNNHDWIVLIISVLGTVFRLHLVHMNKDNRQKITFDDKTFVNQFTWAEQDAIEDLVVNQKKWILEWK